MTDFAKAASEAEQAVRAVKDPELRKIAYERILIQILGGTAGSGSTGGPMVKPPRVKAHATKERNKPGPKAWTAQLVDDGFFSEPRSRKDILDELRSQSHHLEPSDLSRPLEGLCHARRLRRKEIRIGDKKKKIIHWVDW